VGKSRRIVTLRLAGATKRIKASLGYKNETVSKKQNTNAKNSNGQ
jgi:hypothetical protein